MRQHRPPGCGWLVVITTLESQNHPTEVVMRQVDLKKVPQQNSVPRLSSSILSSLPVFQPCSLVHDSHTQSLLPRSPDNIAEFINIIDTGKWRMDLRTATSNGTCLYELGKRFSSALKNKDKPAIRDIHIELRLFTQTINFLKRTYQSR
ncbi:hypothetical protein CBS63078_4442 [Aspergillus niger]|nr:hypothetical protein CBS63078_4442 [Aspergillus niger]